MTFFSNEKNHFAAAAHQQQVRLEMSSVTSPKAAREKNGEAGFTLIEVAIALIVIMVALLGVFVTFTYAISYNAGNNSRAQALAVLQREVELMRSAKFTPTNTDSTAPTNSTDNNRDLTGGTKATRTVTAADGGRYKVDITVDDDPSTPNVIDTNAATTFKEIKVTVKLDNPTPGWQTSIPTTVVLRRTRSN